MLINEFLVIKGKSILNRKITILLGFSITLFFFIFNVHLLVWVDFSVLSNSTFIDHIVTLDSITLWVHVSI
jgi:hypothetical protein